MGSVCSVRAVLLLLVVACGGRAIDDVNAALEHAGAAGASGHDAGVVDAGSPDATAGAGRVTPRATGLDASEPIDATKPIEAAPPAPAMLTVTKPGVPTDAGHVYEWQRPLDCAGVCQRSVVTNESTVLYAEPRGGYVFDRWEGACSGTEPQCVLNLSATSSTDVVARFVPANRVFVTSTTAAVADVISLGTSHTPAGASDSDRLLAGADALCVQLAQSAQLGGTSWVSWLSSSKVGALSRVGTARGWVRVDGSPVFDEVLGGVLYPPSLNEKGGQAGFSVLTGTANGMFDPSGGNCVEWSPSAFYTHHASAGAAPYGTSLWSTYGYLVSCDVDPVRFYCFQTDHNTAIKLPRSPGRMIFASDSLLDASGGIAAFDAACKADAAAAALAGTFKALVADTTTAARGRFTMRNERVVRPDGAVVALTDTGLLERNEAVAAAEVGASGTYYPNMGAWMGAHGANAPAAENCAGWTSNDVNSYGLAAYGGYVPAPFDAPFGPSPCASQFHVYCLQE